MSAQETNAAEKTPMEQLQSWYDEYRNWHDPSPVEDLTRLEA